MRILPSLLLLSLTTISCTRVELAPPGSAAGALTADAGVDADAGTLPDAGIETDAGVERCDEYRFPDGGPADGGFAGGGFVDGGVADGGVPGMISDVLTCGTAKGIPGPAAGTDLQRHDIDLATFPDALCNDGTGAVFYFRPATDQAVKDRWVIKLQGGGACRSGDSCADRWCGKCTNFSAQQMSSRSAPPNGITATGILDDGRPDNPFRNWNQVLVRYCSSDSWTGTARDVVVNAADPLTGAPRTFRLHFLGARIFDAAIATLRQDGVAGPVYVDGEDIERPLPDLDDATEVVLAGASAGGTGTIFNLDRLRDTLFDENNLDCPEVGPDAGVDEAPAGAGCPLTVRGLIDSSFGPARENVDWAASQLCVDQGLCTWEAFWLHDIAAGGVALQEARGDESCESWHAANDPGTEWQCKDSTHVVRHHLTTPFFIRMGQQDSLVSENYREVGFVADTADFADRVRDEMIALQSPSSPPHEARPTPGVFGPPCRKHETLSNSAHAFNTTVTKAAGGVYNMVDVLLAWVTGVGTSSVVADPDAGDTAFCP